MSRHDTVFRRVSGPQPLMRDDSLTESQAAEYVCCDESLLRELRLLRQGPLFSMKNGHVRYRASALDVWLQNSGDAA